MNKIDIKLSIIIVSYNTKRMTIECIESVYENALGKNFEIIILDNASSDGSFAEIREKFPDVKSIFLDENIGFGPGNNVAAEHASGEFLLLLNPDTLILDNAIDKLLDFAEQTPSAHIWGGRTFFSDGTPNLSSCWRHMDLWGLFCQSVGLTAAFRGVSFFDYEAYGGWKRDTVRQVDIVSGCFFLIKRELWHQLGGFDETYFMYAEEADLCLRAAGRGAKPMVTPAAKIVHYGGASETVRSDKMVRLLSGKMTLALKHWPRWKVQIAKMLFKLMVLVRLTGFTVADRVRNNPNDTVKKREWCAIWDARHKWLAGYPQRAAPSA